MFHCPKCKHSAHARTSRYLSENTKERYHQCTNVDCSCTFVTMESVERLIAIPGEAGKARTASLPAV
ncbi:ogr/Delta-like zinc finger family protein [Enterobacter sp. 170198]|uniref:Ogr/Delta-like zinc finger family protein n=1 Tax=Enterobacter chinensis TaxID=3030997 RepID=A0ABU5D3T5_9ENTR|nr:ogr/Delta-like zinc finger family protein [Enterobacter sp. 170198]MDY0418078.1 ogr/Delta-like zinc finger family protein [Enterobacter sp. 170198]